MEWLRGLGRGTLQKLLRVAAKPRQHTITIIHLRIVHQANSLGSLGIPRRGGQLAYVRHQSRRLTVMGPLYFLGFRFDSQYCRHSRMASATDLTGA